MVYQLPSLDFLLSLSFLESRNHNLYIVHSTCKFEFQTKTQTPKFQDALNDKYHKAQCHILISQIHKQTFRKGMNVVHTWERDLPLLKGEDGEGFLHRCHYNIT